MEVLKPSPTTPPILVIGIVVSLFAAPPGAAQARPETPSAAEAFGIEWAGAALGATAAGGIFLMAADDGACGDDFGCIVDAVAGLAAVSSLGGTLGLWLASEVGDTGGSMWGGAAGAVVGSVAGLLVADRIGGDSDAGIAVALGVTQGLVAALGSRIVASLR